MRKALPSPFVMRTDSSVLTIDHKLQHEPLPIERNLSPNSINRCTKQMHLVDASRSFSGAIAQVSSNKNVRNQLRQSLLLCLKSCSAVASPITFAQVQQTERERERERESIVAALWPCGVHVVA